MKYSYAFPIPLILAVFSPVILGPAVYRIPVAAASAPPQISQPEAILETAQILVNRYGSRPPYQGPEFAPGEAMTQEQAVYAIPYLIACESQNRDVQEPDSNGLMSRGILQYQDATWARFSAASGIAGSPLYPNDAIAMTIWALENGAVSNWSCARILRIVS